MQIFPTDDEIEMAADLLVNKYNVSPHLLGELFGREARDQANNILQSLRLPQLTRLDLAKLLIQRKGSGLFAGSHETTRRLRLHLLNCLPGDKIASLFRNHSSNDNISSVSYMLKPLSEMKWHSGKGWPKDFVGALTFPTIFAGIASEDKAQPIHIVPPLQKPPLLAEFQEGLKKRMLQVLNQEGDRTRCVITLPTGGGKTRVAVEAFIEWMQPCFSNRKYLVWIAQSEELCEQAIACIAQMWSSREFVSPLRIYRYFGKYEIQSDDLLGGAVVASINKLYNRINSRDEALEAILKDTGAMIIDEAHRASTSMYDVLLDRAEEICGSNLFPICGLTATPGRAGNRQAEETRKLVDRFETYLVKPEFGKEYEDNPLHYFREHGFLANPHHIEFRSGREYHLTEKELLDMTLKNDIPDCFLERLADDKKRNTQIIRRLLDIPIGTPTLVFACTVEHAYFLSSILSTQGRRAGAVSAETPMVLRRALIHDFKEGKYDFLCNFGVLTTGFDAPKTECIALCRPTTSEVLYEQIIGRGLRGPKFGGTEECKIIDFADNIRRLGTSLAYTRFSDFWTDEKVEA